MEEIPHDKNEGEEPKMIGYSALRGPLYEHSRGLSRRPAAYSAKYGDIFARKLPDPTKPRRRRERRRKTDRSSE